MKNIIKISLIALAAMLAFASCETYKIDEPAHTNVSWLDGKYICFAINDAVSPVDTTVFEVEITNTANDDDNAAWVTITDYSLDHSWEAIYNACYVAYGGSAAYANYYANAYVCYFLAAYRFKVACDGAAKSFSASNAEGTEPQTCYNSFLEQGYYSAAGYWEVYNDYVVNVTGGKVTTDVATASGYTTDGISFDITIDDATGTNIATYKVSGIRKTGWAEDVADYSAWINRQ